MNAKERYNTHITARKLDNMRIPTQAQAAVWAEEDYREFLRRRAAAIGSVPLQDAPGDSPGGSTAGRAGNPPRGVLRLHRGAL